MPNPTDESETRSYPNDHPFVLHAECAVCRLAYTGSDSRVICRTCESAAVSALKCLRDEAYQRGYAQGIRDSKYLNTAAKP